MLNVIVATHESERSLVPTLAALVPGATAGLIGEVVIADAGSRDATAEVAEFAGCRFVVSSESLGVRLKAAAASTRSPWLMFLRAGVVPDPGWVGAAERFIGMARFAASSRAAVFRPPGVGDLLRPSLTEIFKLMHAALCGARPEQGLLIARPLYESIGGHPAGADAEKALLRRIGRQRLATLGSVARTIRQKNNT